MAESFITIEGLREIQRKLLELPAKLQSRAIRNALNSGAKPMKDRARQLVPVDTGFLQENIIQYSVKRSEHEYTDQVRIGVRKRAAKNAKQRKFAATTSRKRRRLVAQRAVTPKYWRHLEFGTSKSPARPFLRPAFETEKINAARIIARRMREEIEKVADK